MEAGTLDNEKNMGIQLFEHNQKAYDAAVSIMDEEGMAAVIHPTGAGKSFMGMSHQRLHWQKQLLPGYFRRLDMWCLCIPMRRSCRN